MKNTNTYIYITQNARDEIRTQNFIDMLLSKLLSMHMFL